MSDIATLYIEKANKIYNSPNDLQRLAVEKAASFEKLSDFRKVIAKNAEIINDFKSISGDICKMIDRENFEKKDSSSKFYQIKAVNQLDISRIYSKFDLIKTVNQRASQVKTKINETKHFLTNEQVAEFEMFIEECLNNLTFDTIDNYEIKLDKTNRQLMELTDQLKAVYDLRSLVRPNINAIKRFLTNEQVAEFEMLIENFDNNRTFGTIGDYKAKLQNANKQLMQLNKTNETISHVKILISKVNRYQLLSNKHQNKIEEFEKLTEDCDNNLTFDTMDNYNAKLENAINDLREFIKECQAEEQRLKEQHQAEEEKQRLEEHQRQRRIEQSNRWKKQGLCQHCGGKFTGLFSKKCTVCGKAKDY